jgi:hypothetical protein
MMLLVDHSRSCLYVLLRTPAVIWLAFDTMGRMRSANRAFGFLRLESLKSANHIDAVIRVYDAAGNVIDERQISIAYLFTSSTSLAFS